jgi:hypothetical protein
MYPSSRRHPCTKDARRNSHHPMQIRCELMRVCSRSFCSGTMCSLICHDNILREYKVCMDLGRLATYWLTCAKHAYPAFAFARICPFFFCRVAPFILGCYPGLIFVSNRSYNGFHPVVDGKIITDLPTGSILAGNYARVPLMVGYIYQSAYYLCTPHCIDFIDRSPTRRSLEEGT